VIPAIATEVSDEYGRHQKTQNRLTHYLRRTQKGEEIVSPIVSHLLQRGLGDDFDDLRFLSAAVWK
jgi:hypothetical protein